MRKAGLNIMMSMKGDGKPVSFIEDCAVPLEHLGEYTERLSEVFRKHGTTGTWYAHASVGTLHVRPILDMRRQGAAQMRAIAEEASAMVREYKGAYSGEHGDGLCRGEWVAWQFGPRLNSAFAEIKALFDPTNRMNPGKIVAPRRWTTRRCSGFPPRTGASRSSPSSIGARGTSSAIRSRRGKACPAPVATLRTDSAWRSRCATTTAIAASSTPARCVPSYRVTRDEQHTTRGRANTLRLALSGQLGGEDLAGDAVHAALDLCVSCKGCKRECPTGVDMAKLKIEALAARAERHGIASARPADRVSAALRTGAQPRAVAARVARPDSRGRTRRRALARHLGAARATALAR